jgi:hypothetical protein
MHETHLVGLIRPMEPKWQDLLGHSKGIEMACILNSVIWGIGQHFEMLDRF